MNQASAAMYCTVMAITGNCLPSTLWVSSATVSTVLRVSGGIGLAGEVDDDVGHGGLLGE